VSASVADGVSLEASKFWQFVTKGTTNVFAVLAPSGNTQLLLFQAKNLGFPVFNPSATSLSSTTILRGLTVFASNAAVGFSYDLGALQLRRTSTFGAQYGISKEMVSGSVSFDGTAGFSVTVLDPTLTTLAGGTTDDPFEIGLQFSYTGSTVMDWDIDRMAGNPGGINGLLDFQLINNFAMAGSTIITLGVGKNPQVPGLDQATQSVLLGLDAYLPSLVCSFPNADIQYLKGDSMVSKRSLLVTSATPLQACTIEPITSLLHLLEPGSNSNILAYVHLMERAAASSSTPELLIYGQGSTILFGYGLSSLSFQVRFLGITDMRIIISGMLDLRIFEFGFTTQLASGDRGATLTTAQTLDLRDPTNTLVVTIDAVFTISWDVDSTNFEINAFGRYCFQSTTVRSRRRNERDLQFGGGGFTGSNPSFDDDLDSFTSSNPVFAPPKNPFDGKVLEDDFGDDFFQSGDDVSQSIDDFSGFDDDFLQSLPQTDLLNGMFDLSADILSGATKLEETCGTAQVPFKFVNGVPCFCIETTGGGEKCFGL
jgi:hypothetical protein